METNQIIPEFQFGDRVRVTIKPEEIYCPRCGEPPNPTTRDGHTTFTGDILMPGKGVFCCSCGHEWPVPEGWWVVIPDYDIDAKLIFPYTLITKLEE